MHEKQYILKLWKLNYYICPNILVTLGYFNTTSTYMYDVMNLDILQNLNEFKAY